MVVVAIITCHLARVFGHPWSKSSRHIFKSGKVEWGRETGGSSYGHEKEAVWCRTSGHPQQHGKSSKNIFTLLTHLLTFKHILWPLPVSSLSQRCTVSSIFQVLTEFQEIVPYAFQNFLKYLNQHPTPKNVSSDRYACSMDLLHLRTNPPLRTTLTWLHISTGTITDLSMQLHHLPRFPYLRQPFLYCD